MTREQAAQLKSGDRVLVFDRGVVEGEPVTIVWTTERGGVKVLQDGRERWLPFGEVEQAR